MGDFTIKAVSADKRTELYYDGNGYSEGIERAVFFASKDNAEKTAKQQHKRAFLEPFLLSGFTFSVVQILRVDYAIHPLDFKTKSTTGFILKFTVNGTERFYTGPKNAKSYGFYLFSDEYNERTVFKSEKEAERCKAGLLADYEATYERMKTQRDGGASYYEYVLIAQTGKVQENY